MRSSIFQALSFGFFLLFSFAFFDRFPEIGFTKTTIPYREVDGHSSWLGGDGAKQFHLDPRRIVVAGESAGGYLTLVTGYRVQPKPKALVALFGFGDLIGNWSSKPNPDRKSTRL